ncbi:MAG: hypothetical protein KC593_20310 [Myxococcales bacterium]|nr:hypothetical protein [Myxococcales bacterium]
MLAVRSSLALLGAFSLGITFSACATGEGNTDGGPQDLAVDGGTPDTGPIDQGMPQICEACLDTSACPVDFECQTIDDNSGQRACLPTCGRDEFDTCPDGWACVGPSGAGVCFPARGCCTVSSVGRACEGTGECGAGVLECDENGGARCSTDPGGSMDESETEICDGLDGDCDGDVDEDFLVGDPCDGTGACGAGTIQCASIAFDPTQMTAVCSSEPGGAQNQALPNDALCNGIDDDCDGRTDEDRGVGMVCDGMGTCGDGFVECASLNTTRCSTDPGGSAAMGGVEICDQQDNNCNGQTDEGFGVGVTCAGVGVCPAGLTECATTATIRCSTLPGGSAFTGAANDMSCNGMDDDCDGRVDEDFGVGTPCDPPGICGPGVLQCNGAGTGVVCSTGPGGTMSQVQTEVCNNMNDDCDGATDEGFNVGSSCDGPGECGIGVTECNTVGGTRCSTGPGGSASQVQSEICDGLDQDCNGVNDNGSISSLCPNGSNVSSTICAGAGGCQIMNCAPNTFNADNVYGNGCECADTETSSDNSCTNGVNDFNPAIGATQTRDGIIWGAGDSDWYQAVIPAGLNSGIRIEFSSNPGNALRFDLNQTGCSTAPDCSGSNGYTGLQLSTRHNCLANIRPGDPGTDIYNGCNSTAARTYYIRVYRGTGSATCIPYTLQVRAGESTQ